MGQYQEKLASLLDEKASKKELEDLDAKIEAQNERLAKMDERSDDTKIYNLKLLFSQGGLIR